MQLINRSTQPTLWSFFGAADPMAATAFGVPDQIVSLNSGSTKTISVGAPVQIKVFTSLQPQKIPSLTLSAMSALPAPAVNATRNNTFDNSLMVVFTGFRLVKLDDKFRKLVGLEAAGPAAEGASVSVQIARVAGAVLTLAKALVDHAWTDKSTKWIEQGTFEVALALIDIFEPTADSHALSLDDVRNVVQDVIDQNEARLLTPDVFDAAAWLDKWVEKSRSLAVGQADPTTAKLSDYDRKEFLRELRDHHDGRTPFWSSMSKLLQNRDIRKHVIPTYLMGVLLHLHFELLSLGVKQESTPIDSADVNALLRLATNYARTLPELEQDYVGLCRDLANQYPLGVSLELIGQPDPVEIVWIGPKPPDPVEGLALGRAALTKWLNGDRALISKTGEKLNTFIEGVKKKLSAH